MRVAVIPYTDAETALKALVPSAEEQISRFGWRILQTVKIGTQFSAVSAIDGRMYQSVGRLWHKKHRLEGMIPAGLRNVTPNQVGQSRLHAVGCKVIVL